MRNITTTTRATPDNGNLGIAANNGNMSITSANSLKPKNPWLLKAKPLINPDLRLFCFCHAGGSATVFHTWHKQLPANIEVCAIQYPGRGQRIREALIDDYDAMVDAISTGIMGELDRPYAFFGHSMGAMLSFGVARKLREHQLPQPIQLFISGCRAPQHELGRKPVHKLPKAEFIQRLQHLNGTPKEALEHAELMDMMEPVLRADFKIVETRQYQAAEQLAMPIAVFGGCDDEWVSTDYLDGWREQTGAGFYLQLYSGDHFYYLQETQALLRKLTDMLCLSASKAIK